MHCKLQIQRTTLAAALVAVLLAVASPSLAGGGRHGFGDRSDWVERHAEALGIDDATLAEIKAIVAASRDEAKTIYRAHREAREALHDLLDQPEPDVDAVMKQAEVMGEIDVRKHKHRLATMLAVRAKLTPEQRVQLRELKGEMRDRKGHRHHRDRGECSDEDADATL